MRRSIEERLWDKVARSPTCWRWTGHHDEHGYGRIVTREDGKVVSAYVHRLSYALAHGPISAGLQVDHLCRVRDCVNPAHLELTSPRVNNLRGTSRAAVYARRTACKHGHPLQGDNVALRGGARVCKTCARLRQARFRAERGPTCR